MAKEKASTAVAVKPTESNSVESFISQAIGAGAPIETLERIFALREKVKAEAAKEAFVTAMATFQSECPVIKKTKRVNSKDGKLRYMFAPIDSIVEQIKGPLGKATLSYSWDVTNTADSVTAKITITHSLGHSTTSEFTIPVDKESYMTAPQKFAAALTFAKRYTLCNALGISTGDEDEDATTVSKEKEPKNDKAKIMFLLRTLEEEVKTAVDVERAVLKHTELIISDKNLKQVVERLEAIVKKKTYEEPIIQ